MSPDALRMDRTLPGVGRIARAITTDPRTFAAFKRMVDVLYAQGKLDILRNLRDGVLAPMQLYDAYRRNALDELPSADTAGDLAKAMRTWEAGLTDADAVPEHRRGLRVAVRRLESAMPGATIQQAPEALKAVRGTHAKHPRAFNLTRAALQAFLRDTLTKAHPTYHAVAAVPSRRVAKSRRSHPLTPDEMRSQFPNPTTDPVDAIAWTMATTGMGPGELWGSWKMLGDRVRIEGTKRDARRREVPLVAGPDRPTISRKAFELRLRRREGTDARPYDFRRTYATWMEAAGVPRTRRRAYLGHSAGDVTDLYERHEVAAYLAKDAERIRGHVWPETPVGPTLRLVRGGAGNG